MVLCKKAPMYRATSFLTSNQMITLKLPVCIYSHVWQCGVA